VTRLAHSASPVAASTQPVTTTPFAPLRSSLRPPTCAKKDASASRYPKLAYCWSRLRLRTILVRRVLGPGPAGSVIAQAAANPDNRAWQERPEHRAGRRDKDDIAGVAAADVVTKPCAEPGARHHGDDDPYCKPLPMHADYPDILSLGRLPCPAYPWLVTSDSLGSARALLDRFPVIDGHNDLAWALRAAGSLDPAKTDISAPVEFTHTDLPRLAKGGVGAQFWSVYVPAELQGEAAVATTLEQIDLVRQLASRYPDRLELAVTAADVQRIMRTGKVASLLGAEGGHSIACSMGTLRALYQLGVRYLTLTHNLNLPWADSATDSPAAGGLTAFGREVVREMQRLGMLVDLSHVAATTMSDALDTAEAPVIFSHSSSRAICDHPRNVPDTILARLAGNGGLCMITFVPAFVSQRCRDWELELVSDLERRGIDYRDLSNRKEVRQEWARTHPRPDATLADVVAHAEHVREVAGIDHIGLGGDFDGVDRLPHGLEDVSCYPALISALLERGWSQADCGKLTCGNLLRVMRTAEETAGMLRASRPPSAARIEDLDREVVG